VAREDWLKDTNNEARARKFSRKRKEAHNIIRSEKRNYVLKIIAISFRALRLSRT